MEPVGDTMPIAELLDERRHLLEVAHWMLGSRIAAERVIDEAYREWYGLSDRQRAGITAPRAWLSRIVGTICLARLSLPDPPGAAQGSPRERGRTDTAPASDVGAELLRPWNTLSPAERAAFVLDDVLGMATGTVEGVVGQSGPEWTEPANRARHSLRARRAEPTPPRRQDEIAHAVRQACADEDTERLASLLTPDVTAFFDGGGKVRALTRPVTGSEGVARSLLTLLARHPRTTLQTYPVNGRTGLIARYDDQVAAVVTLDMAGSRVVQVWVVLNPDKLRSWNR
ncbi:RNA polymerase subunit sigma [Streptomyces chromofuscus]|uniref:RNA polymerase subunit sigma n=1 Tax=Streptomyces chromofuscus TaxID=42881 RepID=A0A7M2T900_STRCW|nr:RNA polymerase subunit sigma [Streptomyces chromofuscus]QOV45196.1 RNA polymerase subunit sigma [Streptomyces chromofuscus]GGS99610.1 RNA polymerase sigma factor [Streptomyces chromofuscus]